MAVNKQGWSRRRFLTTAALVVTYLVAATGVLGLAAPTRTAASKAKKKAPKSRHRRSRNGAPERSLKKDDSRVPGDVPGAPGGGPGVSPQPQDGLRDEKRQP